MGGLFSSTPTEQPHTRQRSYYSPPTEQPQTRPSQTSYYPSTSYHQPGQPTRPRYDYETQTDLPLMSYLLRVRAGSIRTQETRRVSPETRVHRDPHVLNIEEDPYFNDSRVVTFIPLSPYDTEYQKIRNMVTNKRNFKIDSIERIENPYLKKAYELKKEQKQEQYLYCEERLLFHGTTHENFNNICKFNFNWRLCQTHKYGAGVSFSPNSTYASNYSDEYLDNKVMIVAKVLIGRSCLGNSNMVLPDEGCDTSQKGQDGIVIVKYEDNDFCPVFKINYHLVNPNIGKRRYRGGSNSFNDYNVQSDMSFDYSDY